MKYDIFINKPYDWEHVVECKNKGDAILYGHLKLTGTHWAVFEAKNGGKRVYDSRREIDNGPTNL